MNFEEFGLQRVINFPPSRKQSERTYLLKTLAGCPISTEKIERLLNITILQQNGNFTENDLFLIFSMLSGGSSGYTTLFNFLSQNWDTIKMKYVYKLPLLFSTSEMFEDSFDNIDSAFRFYSFSFKDKTNLWDNLISSATGVFTTQEGYDMVSKLYAKRQGEFGSADHIIEKSLKNIKEETKWSDANLPVIEKWLDDYLQTINVKDNKFL